ncbi:PAS domain-containing sensor histidine kinase, partial [Ralstonia pickettii]|nr:PAS domain-containing sensor histidine kinase [Ralstonia pickettii]
SDNGPGFPARILTRAFEPYVTTKAKGTGLGLATVKKIVDELGARIDLRNRMHGETVEGAQVSILFLQMASDAPGAESGVQDGTAPAKTKASEQTKAA